jgi:hypothetical protein
MARKSLLNFVYGVVRLELVCVNRIGVNFAPFTALYKRKEGKDSGDDNACDISGRIPASIGHLLG